MKSACVIAVREKRNPAFFHFKMKFTIYQCIFSTVFLSNLTHVVLILCLKINFRKSIAPGEEIRETVQMKPRRLGRKEIIASFHSKQVCDITGVTEVDVIEENRN